MYHAKFYVFILLAFLLSACGSNEVENVEEENYPSANLKLKGKKWMWNSENISIGDDWIGVNKYITKVYFHSANEGILYTSTKDDYSDIGASTDRRATHFKYELSGNNIILDYITDKGPYDVTTLGYDGEYLLWKETKSQKQEIISNDDYNWIKTLCGNTGDCKWYHDMNTTLWITGEGKMADYDSYNNTPWKKNNQGVRTAVLSKGVDHLGAYAFADMTVEEIENGFYFKSVGEGTFQSSSLKTDPLPDMKIIPANVCRNCSNIYGFLGESVEEIGKYAYSSCRGGSLAKTPNLRIIREGAFDKTPIADFTKSEVLTDIEDYAFTKYKGKCINLPNSLKSIGNMAFNGPTINEIHVGTELTNVHGSPFFADEVGKIYVNKNKPLKLECDFVIPYSGEKPKKWTLYVPKGSASAYKAAQYWNNFGKIVEDETLKGDGTTVEEEKPDEPSGEQTTDAEQDIIDAKDSRRGNVSSSLSGKGTASSPYLISSAADLRFLSDECRAGNTFKGKYFKMTSDITINKNVLDKNGNPNDSRNFERWIPIGRSPYKDCSFQGYFDGDNHYVAGIYINRSAKSSHNGLFGFTCDTRIENITLKDSYIAGGWASGIVGDVGYLTNSSTCKISNCYNYATVVGKTHAAGIVLSINRNYNISKCVNYGNITCLNTEEGAGGGIIGSGKSTTSESYITDCANYGNIKGRMAGGIGGVVKAITTNCANYGNVSAHLRAGGIIGLLDHRNIKNCINIGDITSDYTSGASVGAAVTVGASHCHYLSQSCSDAFGSTSTKLTKSNINACSINEMKSEDVLNSLNKYCGSYSKWETGNNGYPKLSWIY